MRILFFHICVLSLFAIPPAQAEERVTIGGLIGVAAVDPDLAIGNNSNQLADSPSDSLALGVRAGYQFTVHLRTETELSLFPTSGRNSGASVALIAWRFHLLVDLLPMQRLRPFALVGAGVLALPSRSDLLGQDSDLTAHAGLGVEFDLNPSVALRLGIRTAFAPARSSAFATNLELFAGATLYFPDGIGGLPPDKDHDGVFDDFDQCLDAAEDQDGFEDEDGCPDLDNDHDGIPDSLDLCPSDAEDTRAETPDGCPETL